MKRQHPDNSDANQPIYHTRKYLYQKYVTENLLAKEIGDECNVSGNTIAYWLKKHKINTRPRGEGRRISHINKVGSDLYCNKSFLENQYIVKMKSSSEIARMCGVASSLILDYLRTYNIQRRDVVECHKSDDHEKLDNLLLKNGRGWFMNKYESLLSVAKLAKHCDVGKGVMIRWLAENEIALSDDDGRFKKGSVPANKKYEGGNIEKKRIGRDELHDWYVLDRLKYVGVVNPTQEMIELKRQGLLMHRTLKQFKQWRQENESDHTDVHGEQFQDEKDHESGLPVGPDHIGTEGV